MARLLSFTRNGWAGLRPTLTAIATVSVLGGCAIGWPFMQAQEDRVEAFRSVQLDAIAWTPPTAIVAVDRAADRARETAFYLENHTALDGDNVLMLVSYTEERAPAFEFEKLLERFPASTKPFATEDYTDLRRGEDGLGSFLWAERRIDDATCVLAMRRLNAAQRPVELGIGALDVVLRNCVEADRDEALAALSFLPQYGAASPFTTTRNLSVLAAPIAKEAAIFTGGAQ